MILFLDTSTNTIRLGLAKDSQLVAEHSWESKFRHSEELLPTLEKFLKKSKVKLNNLRGIIVVSGPGSFTGLRVGIATANTLAFILGIPVVGIKSSESKALSPELLKNKLKKAKVGEFVIPFYGQEPKITLEKKVDKFRKLQ